MEKMQFESHCAKFKGNINGFRFFQILLKTFIPSMDDKTCTSQQQNQRKRPNYECFKWKVAESHLKALVELKICWIRYLKVEITTFTYWEILEQTGLSSFHIKFGNLMPVYVIHVIGAWPNDIPSLPKYLVFFSIC